MKRVLFIIASKDFRDDELEVPKSILEDSGFICDVASTVNTPVKGMLGLLVKPDLLVDNVDVSNYASIIIVGGGGSPELSRNKKILGLLQLAFNSGKVLGSICLGSLAMVKSGVLNNRKGTGWKCSETLSAFRENGATYSENGVVVDGKIVTAQGPAFAKEFGMKILELLTKG